jgi:hypothetical protein
MFGSRMGKVLKLVQQGKGNKVNGFAIKPTPKPNGPNGRYGKK